jgi:hypothetical protein
VRKISPRILATKELAVSSQQSAVSHFLFYQEIFYQNNMTVVPHLPYFSMFPRLKLKLKGSHFDRIEVIEAESHAVPNTLTEHDFQDVF